MAMMIITMINSNNVIPLWFFNSSPLLNQKPDLRFNKATAIRYTGVSSATRLSHLFGIRGFPRLRHFWSSGPPTGYGGQASHDYSWFGFIGLFYILVINIANAMPTNNKFVTYWN